jgi:hypothetical protein
MRASALFLAILPLPALAETPLRIDLQENLPYLEQAEVAGGTLSTIATDLDGVEGRQLVFNGAPVPGVADRHVHIQGKVPRPEFEGEDLVFVTLAGGGNACPALWAIVVTSAAGAQASQPFGTCSEAILNPRVNLALVWFDMAPVAEGQPWSTFIVDGAEVFESRSPEKP